MVIYTAVTMVENRGGKFGGNLARFLLLHGYLNRIRTASWRRHLWHRYTYRGGNFLPADIIISAVLIAIFILFSGFFSSSEAAFLSLQRTRLTYLVNNNVPGAKRVQDMINNMDRLLSTILLGNNLVNVAFTALVTALAVNWLSLIHIWRCRRSTLCRSRWSPYH